MIMVGQEHPGITAGARLVEHASETAQEIIPVRIVPEDDGPVHTSPHDVVESASSVDARLTRHIFMIGRKLEN
jgi:hypothetical protein